MVSPFRCVDEINQGLDDRNERLVFKRIVENSTKPPGQNGPTDHCGQYWLITPKLLPNLFDMEVEAMNVMCIFNGTSTFKSSLVDSFLGQQLTSTNLFLSFITSISPSYYTGPHNLRRPTDWDTENLVAMIKQWRQDNARRIQPVDDEENHENASEPSSSESPKKRPRITPRE